MVYWLEERSQLGITGQLNDEMLEAFYPMFQKRIVNSGKLEIMISSPGGYCTTMSAILAQMRTAKAAHMTLRTVGSGRVESAAVPLLAMGTKGERYIVGRDTVVMVHEIILSTQMETLTTSEHQTRVELLQRNLSDYIAYLALLSGRKREWWRRRIVKKGDVYLYADEAVEFGLADKVVDVMPPPLKTDA